MKRRSFLVAVPLAAVAGCATGPSTPARVIADVQGIAGALAAELPAILSAVGVGSAQATQITGYVSDIQAVAVAIGKATTAAAAAPLAQQAIADVQAVAPIILAAAGLPPGTVAAIEAALSLLPVIAAAVGLAGAEYGVPEYDADAARLILRAAATK